MNAKGSRGPWLWPLALVVIGLLLLLSNFLFLTGLDIASLWPLALVMLGAVILLQGDFSPGTEARTFGITRGSVESATLEIYSGEIDVTVRSLSQPGRLIAGQYAQDSRPALTGQDTHTSLKMERAATSWLSFADWEMALARDLPWGVFVSTSFGQVTLDLASVIVSDVRVGTGFGDVKITVPYEALGSLQVRSALGNIHLVTPFGHRVQVRAKSSRFFGVRVDPLRYEEREAGVYESREANPDAPLVQISLQGTFGDAYLA